MWTSIQVDDPRFMHGFVGDRNDAGRLHDLVCVPVDIRHHRARQASGDTPCLKIIGLQRQCSAIPISAELLPKIPHSRLDCGRDFPIRGIAHEPRPTVVDLSRFVNLLPLIPTRAQLQVALTIQASEFRFRKVLNREPLQSIGASHRNVALVAVAEGTLQVRVAPRCARRRIRTATGPITHR
jgi:hypothetical protein